MKSKNRRTKETSRKKKTVSWGGKENRGNPKTTRKSHLNIRGASYWEKEQKRERKPYGLKRQKKRKKKGCEIPGGQTQQGGGDKRHKATEGKTKTKKKAGGFGKGERGKKTATKEKDKD